MFAGIAAILLGLIALPTINIGGFVIGTLLALVGGGLAVAWTPRPGWTAPTWGERHRRAQQAPTEPLFAEGPSGDSTTETFEAAEAELTHRQDAEKEDGSAESQI
jgi:hypothetical protein